jgi:2-keto-4-pentenoate hydratase/2-oxohepta-3-ene-1,7-dioic acid hydratase in catechol pathway
MSNCPQGCPNTPMSGTQLRKVSLIPRRARAQSSHAKESGAAIPKFPVLFFKPVTALASGTDDIPVCKLAQQSPEVDYECELVVIIGKQGKDIPEDKALDYVLGYAVGDDVSHRGWQLQRGGGQWGTGKMFDGWAPISGAIVSPEVASPETEADCRSLKILIISGFRPKSTGRRFRVRRPRI